jgi:hypothetical protein
MSRFIGEREPDRLADDLAVMLAQASDPRRNQHTSQGGPPPLVDLALAVLLPSSTPNATRVEVERDAAQTLAPQNSAGSLAGGLASAGSSSSRNDTTLTLGPFTQVVTDELVAEQPRPATGPPTGLVAPGPRSVHHPQKPPACVARSSAPPV